MLIQAPTPSPTSTFLIHQPLFPRSASLNVSRVNGVMNTWSSRRELSRRMVVSAADDQSNSTANSERKRKVVEHICLLKTKENLTDEEEKDMLDYLYTTQYQMRGIVAISLGRISEENLENYTHAVYMRFQIKEDLAKFYENPFYLGVLKKHVMPYCHGLINVDYEAEVEDDILPIFRKGEEFNYGVEFVLLISFVDDAFGVPVQHALASLARLTHGFPSLIVQSTQGLNCNPGNKEFTHGVVIRFRSLEAFEIFVGSSEYKEMWRSEFQPITQRTLSIHFSVDPVGTEIM
ncbi:hypothetical protein RGQ29_007786 [Quercus rubra]|uniref:Stress-response A/B barrel domain-containing protein n=1 Tax=Quercus rubra TaxID=3512 RepID=A0AAN7I3E1_QUERU|nr:hypothetical protein RGQ29_007786 [Quercus rubra]KAK4558162.1 hypothetical protein RGQ29_007786 [Quercus rubra]KAK4558163.1 hypothetical protein RGQ29_007786 [Quercus rubra]